MDTATLLHQSRLSLITRDADAVIRNIRDVISQPVMVDGRADVEEVLNRLARANGPCVLKTLDLIGHSTPDRSLLVLGDWVLDGTNSTVTAFFRGLADCDVLSRIGVHSIRLLGCDTATSEVGRQTLIKLSDILEIEAFGTTRMIDSGFYDASGFRDDHRHALVSSSDVRRDPIFELVKRGGEPYRSVLDIDFLPSSPLGRQPPHPRRIADPASARRILALVRRADGAQMPGLVASPSCELALPSVKRDWYHRLQIMLDGEFVRVYPNGEDRPGVLFPVEDAATLLTIVDELPAG